MPAAAAFSCMSHLIPDEPALVTRSAGTPRLELDVYAAVAAYVRLAVPVPVDAARVVAGS